ncbi:MAG: hypothetical protein HY822_00445 [Acidobacteria bacterium]|nr:hypothetical protein [Acidobacteriota bacterium]
MGFALWVDGDVACAEGTHEYRPLGMAVVASSTLFGQRDFRPGRTRRPRSGRSFAGFFGSLVEVNAHLLGRRRGRKVRPEPARAVLPYF